MIIKKFFVECLDDTPEIVEGNNYVPFLKKDGRRFFKLNIDEKNDDIFVIVPPWYSNGNGNIPIPYFKLVDAGTITKFMSEALVSRQQLNIAPFSMSDFVTADCKQQNPVSIYELQPINLEDLKKEFSSGGARGIIKKNKKTKKSKKHRRKSKKYIRRNKSY